MVCRIHHTKENFNFHHLFVVVLPIYVTLIKEHFTYNDYKHEHGMWDVGVEWQLIRFISIFYIRKVVLIKQKERHNFHSF